MRRPLASLLLLVALGAPAAAQAPPTPPPPGPLVERLDLRGATVADVARLIAETTGWNVIATPAAGAQQVTLLLQRVPARTAVEAMCKAAGLWYREEDGVLRIMTAAELRQDLVVRREPQVAVFTLLQPNALAIAQAIRDVWGDRVALSFGIFDSLSADASFGTNGFNTGQGAGAGGGLTTGNVNGQGAGTVNGQTGANNVLFPGVAFERATQRQSERDERASERAAEAIKSGATADQLSRIQVQDGRAVGEAAAGLTEERPPIWVAVNRRHNVLVVRTADERAMAELTALVRDLDRPLPQVLLEMKILEVTLDDGLETALDVDWVEDVGSPFTDTTAGMGALAQAAGLGNLPAAGGAIIYQYLNDHIRVRFQALEREGRLAILATPLLLCAHQEVSSIFIGEQRPVVTGFDPGTVVPGGSNNATTITPPTPVVDLRDIGNTLRIVPRINADRTVALTIVQDVSSVNVNGAVLPVVTSAQGDVTLLPVDTVNTSNLQGTVVAKDGLTLAIGGLIRKEMSDRQSGIPLLMDIPLVGWLFGSTERVEVQRELVLLITPHVLTTPAEAERRSRLRLEALSIHPYHDLQDAALQRFGREDVPGSADHRLHLEDHLLGAPEPIR